MRPVISELRPTDFPEPVAPAMRRCGIFVRSARKTSPSMDLPIGRGRVISVSRNLAVPMTSRRRTSSRLRFGISTPMADFPGMGANMRTPDAAIAIARSSSSDLMRLTFTPGAGVSSYRVTVGPTTALMSSISTL
jgi:hypothetical protein